MVLTKEHIQKIIKRYEDGSGLARLGKDFNVTTGTIRYHLLRNNIDIRAWHPHVKDAKVVNCEILIRFNIPIKRFKTLCVAILGEEFNIANGTDREKFKKLVVKKGAMLGEPDIDGCMQQLLYMADLYKL